MRKNLKMAEVVFYQCKRKKEWVLATLLEKSLAQGSKVIVRTNDSLALDRFLWSYRDDSFLPHSASYDEQQANQPIWITEGEENPNGADHLMVLDSEPFALDQFKRCLYLFDDGDDRASAKATEQQKRLQGQYPITLWRQTDQNWVKEISEKQND